MLKVALVVFGLALSLLGAAILQALKAQQDKPQLP